MAAQSQCLHSGLAIDVNSELEECDQAFQESRSSKVQAWQYERARSTLSILTERLKKQAPQALNAMPPRCVFAFDIYPLCNLSRSAQNSNVSVIFFRAGGRHLASASMYRA